MIRLGYLEYSPDERMQGYFWPITT